MSDGFSLEKFRRMVELIWNQRPAPPLYIFPSARGMDQESRRRRVVWVNGKRVELREGQSAQEYYTFGQIR